MSSGDGDWRSLSIRLGSLAMPKSRKPPDPFTETVVARLVPLGDIRVRPMFGGRGVYADGLFFALIDHGQLYLKVDDQTFPAYAARGIALFRPLPDRPDFVIRYCPVPPDIFGGPALIE